MRPHREPGIRRDEHGRIYAYVRGASGQQRFKRFPSGTSLDVVRRWRLDTRVALRMTQPARGTLATDIEPFLRQFSHRPRLVVLIVGDAIRPAAEELVAGLQAHANFHFTFALVEMPVYTLRHPDSVREYVVMPRTLVKTVDVPRFTIRTEGDSTAVIDNGTDEEDARKPSRAVSTSLRQPGSAFTVATPRHRRVESTIGRAVVAAGQRSHTARRPGCRSSVLGHPGGSFSMAD